MVDVEVNKAHGELLSIDADFYYSVGGRYSAKTHEIISDRIDHAFASPGYKIAESRKVYSSIKESLFEDTLKILKMHGAVEGTHYKKTVSPLHISLFNGSEIIFRGMDNSEKNAKGLSGVNCFILDELNEYLQADLEAIEMSIRGLGDSPRIYMAHNPVPLIPGSKYWFQEMFDPGCLVAGKPVVFTKKSIGRIAALKSTYRDNKFCPDRIKQRLEGYKKTNYELWKLWACGDYAELKGAILHGWDIVDKVPDSADFIGYGLDFGFSNDPAACVGVWGSKKEIWVKGLVYSTDLSNRQLYDKLTAHGITRADKLVADSAEPKSISYLYDEGLKGIRGVKKKPNYKAEMANVLKGMKIHLISGDIDLQREFGTWSWDTDKTGKQLPKPKDGNDHYMDALIMILHDYRGNRGMSLGGI